MEKIASILRVVVTEKPSVARDIARVLGAGERHDGFFSGGEWIVTWAVGHLVALAQPQDVDPRWKAWRRDDLPMIPERWPLVILPKTAAQFAIIKDLMNRDSTADIICATDAGREGELIFRYIQAKAGNHKPVKRLWLSSLTAEAIAEGFSKLREQSAFDGLADSAMARSRADWLVGMNLSRAYSLKCGDLMPIGRVQTPTLAMIVERDQNVRNFVPESYKEVWARFAWRGDNDAVVGAQGVAALSRAKGGRPKGPIRFPPDGEAAKALLGRIEGKSGVCSAKKDEVQRVPPPELYDLNALQRHANRLHGFTAQDTLDLAQELYEKHKLISYPRTDAKVLSKAVAKECAAIAAKLKSVYPALVTAKTGASLGPRFINDKKVTDHHAIIPTGKAPSESLSPRARKVFDMIARRFFLMWHEDYVEARVEAWISIDKDECLLRGTTVLHAGWKEADGLKTSSDPLPLISKGQKVYVTATQVKDKQTLAPGLFTDATLIRAMERIVDNGPPKRVFGLGTPATRSNIIETLIKRGFIKRDKKAIRATEKGEHLVANVDQVVCSPRMTGEWEERLESIRKEKESLPVFTAAIAAFVTSVIQNIGQSPKISAHKPQQTPVAAEGNVIHSNIDSQSSRPSPPPYRGGDVNTTLLRFGYSEFRTGQEDICKAIIAGRDALVVMPTGMGKSLCYQLPGAILGPALVFSPLIALMDDQIRKLTANGFRAGAIHSGLGREDARAHARAYAEGTLDFLFLAPERLAVPGVIEWLERNRPRLIAVDEAHCISHWGHDFRSEYRRLGERLQGLRTCPIVALTATATPRVQGDIVGELRLKDALISSHGFRRDNLAITAQEVQRSQRLTAISKLLANDSSRPAIIYAGTRKEVDKIATGLKSKFRAGAYHAGLEASTRRDVANDFFSGKIDVIAATTAFGMGIDKSDIRTVIHSFIPASIENYYQEIGRAGRDGAPARTVLMYAAADLYTHDFLHKKNFPETQDLETLFKKLPAKLERADSLRGSEEPEVLEALLDKLWVHGGLVRSGNQIAKGGIEWLKSYKQQKKFKKDEPWEMLKFARDESLCRMTALVRHFGERGSSAKNCGICDICAAKKKSSRGKKSASLLS